MKLFPMLITVKIQHHVPFAPTGKLFLKILQIFNNKIFATIFLRLLNFIKRVGCNDEKLISEVCISLVPESTMTLSTQCPLALKATGCFHMEIDGVQHRRGYLEFAFDICFIHF